MKFLATIISVCSSCKKTTDMKTHESEKETGIGHIALSHGFCDPCLEVELEKLENPKEDLPNLGH
jgi:hypothetical protein